jgi:phosphoglycerol transferase MdoB-like AlkP superfamily enzyme
MAFLFLMIMLARIKFLLAYLLFWVLFFESARLLFLFYHYSRTKGMSFQTRALSFVYGLRMDLSAASYVLAFVCLMVLLSVFIPFFRRSISYKIYSYLVLFFVLLITIADLEVYRSWGFRLDATPLKYLESPKEVWASIAHLPLFWIILLFIVAYAGLCLLLKRFIDSRIYLLQPNKNKWAAAAIIVFCMAFLIVPMRGGFQLTPMNQSMVYFSRENFANITAVNPTWNFLNGLFMGASTKNPYQYLDDGTAKAVVDSLYSAHNKTEIVLKTPRPNVIVVIWESFTEKATRIPVDGVVVTPKFNELKKEGIYFGNVYASGDRTDKGIAAVLSGYPSMNNVSIIRFPGKSSKLNTLGHFFKEFGYQTSFYYGGETEFANIKSYILQSHYDKLTDKNDFSSKDQNSKWGAHDGVVADKIWNDLSNMAKPFFITWLTLSSHEPFEIPAEPAIKNRDMTTKFANSLYYTDGIIFNFVQRCKQQPWWDNTVMVIIADHGHPMIEPSNQIENFKIPMLWLGGALTRQGSIDKYASQIDLASTLSAQLKADPSLFPFSKNILDSTSGSWAYYCFNNGFGFVQKEGAFVFDNVGRQNILRKGTVTENDLRAGKALQQHTFQNYIDQ